LDARCAHGAASWNPAGEILFQGEDYGIFRISQRGGLATRVTTVESSREVTHNFPRWLPDGRRFVYTVIGPNPDKAGIYAGALDGPSVTRIVPDVSKSDYVTGSDGASYLVFVRGRRLVAQRVHPTTLAPVGDARVLAERMGIGNAAMPSFSASATLLVHRSGGSSRRSAWVWLDRQGRPEGRRHAGVHGGGATLSPDESNLVYPNSNPDGPSGTLWMVDYARRIEQPLLDFPTSVSLPVFSRNGRRIAFATIDVRGRELYVMDFPNGKPMRIPTTPTVGFLVSSWSLDDRVLIGSTMDGRVVSMSLDSPGNPVTLLANGGQRPARSLRSGVPRRGRSQTRISQRRLRAPLAWGRCGAVLPDRGGRPDGASPSDRRAIRSRRAAAALQGARPPYRVNPIRPRVSANPRWATLSCEDSCRRTSSDDGGAQLADSGGWRFRRGPDGSALTDAALSIAVALAEALR
jgi:hypothetical protein